MASRILFVCLGNICRSPGAEAVTRHMAEARGLSPALDSAGTGDWHLGAPPYGPMQDAAARRGYDLSDLRARQVVAEDFRRFDLILGMDAQNMADLSRIAPRDATAVLGLFTDYGPSGADHVPDPYYTRDFDAALDLIEGCAAGLVATL